MNPYTAREALNKAIKVVPVSQFPLSEMSLRNVSEGKPKEIKSWSGWPRKLCLLERFRHRSGGAPFYCACTNMICIEECSEWNITCEWLRYAKQHPDKPEAFWNNFRIETKWNYLASIKGIFCRKKSDLFNKAYFLCKHGGGSIAWQPVAQ